MRAPHNISACAEFNTFLLKTAALYRLMVQRRPEGQKPILLILVSSGWLPAGIQPACVENSRLQTTGNTAAATL